MGLDQVEFFPRTQEVQPSKLNPWIFQSTAAMDCLGQLDFQFYLNLIYLMASQPTPDLPPPQFAPKKKIIKGKFNHWFPLIRATN